MQIFAQNPDEYLEKLDPEKREIVSKLRKIVKENLPDGFEEIIQYGMLDYVVPHSIYSDGYHCDKTKCLPFISIAAQKNYVSFYHMGLYSIPSFSEWFTKEFSKYPQKGIETGKSCIKFKKSAYIPYDFLGEVCTKISVKEWIENYEKVIKK